MAPLGGSIVAVSEIHGISWHISWYHLMVSDGIWDDFMVALPCISSFRYRALLEKLTALFWDDVAQVAARTGL